jgi:hypothetical protein
MALAVVSWPALAARAVQFYGFYVLTICGIRVP